MAMVFLDANVFIDYIEHRKNLDATQLVGHSLYISPLSIHVLSYVYKYRMPEKRLENVDEIFTIIPFDQIITVKALQGPTTDFEDNVQLHSTTPTQCDFFLTTDRKLLTMRFFGKTQIVSQIRPHTAS